MFPRPTLTPHNPLLSHFPQRQSHALIYDHHNHLLQKRHKQQYRDISIEQAKAPLIREDRQRGIDEPHEEKRQRDRDRKQYPLLALFCIFYGLRQRGDDEAEDDECGDEEPEPGFAQRLHFVDTRFAEVVACVDAADDGEDEAHRDQEFGELHVSWGYGGWGRAIDAL